MDVTTLAVAKAYTDNSMDSISDTVSVSEITWDGNTAGRKSLHDLLGTYCHVSPLTPSFENLEGGSLTITDNSGNVEILEYTKAGYDEERKQIIPYGGAVFICLEDIYESDGTVIKAGVWMGKDEDNGKYVSKLTFGKPMEIRVLKDDAIPSIPVLDLDSCGINLTQALLAGGGIFEVNASPIFDSIEHGKNYLFSATLLLDNGEPTKLEFPPAFYQYSESGELFRIGFSFAGTLQGKYLQGNGMLERESFYLVLTPLGS